MLYDGELIDSLNWVPLDDFIGHLRKQVPDHLLERCQSASGKAEGGWYVGGPFTVQ